MKKLLLVIGGVMLGAVGLAQPAAAYTCPDGTVRAGNSVKSAVQCNVESDEDAGNSEGLMGVMGNIINVLIGITSIITVFMIIFGGISMATSQGDAAKVKKGRDTMLFGVVGLVIAMLAFAIINFVMKNVFGSGF